EPVWHRHERTLAARLDGLPQPSRHERLLEPRGDRTEPGRRSVSVARARPQDSLHRAVDRRRQTAGPPGLRARVWQIAGRRVRRTDPTFSGRGPYRRNRRPPVAHGNGKAGPRPGYARFLSTTRARVAAGTRARRRRPHRPVIAEVVRGPG